MLKTLFFVGVVLSILVLATLAQRDRRPNVLPHNARRRLTAEDTQ